MSSAARFKFGLAELRARRFENAVGAFIEVRKLHSKDKPFHLYIERTQHLVANPSPGDWGGVLVMLDKLPPAPSSRSTGRPADRETRRSAHRREPRDQRFR